MRKLYKLLWLYFFIWLACPLFSQTQGIISNATIIPPNYHTFAGPDKSGDSYVDPVFGTIVKRITDSGKWAPNGNGGEVANSEIAYFNIDDSFFMVSEIVKIDGNNRNANVLYDGRTGEFIKILGSDNLRPWWCRWAVADRYKKNGSYVHFDPVRHFYKYEGNEVRLYNVHNLSHVVLHKFTEYNEIGPAGGEGDISLDGRYWLLDGDDRELFLYDLIDDIKYPASTFDLGTLGSEGSAVGVDYGAVSALGNYIIVSWSYEASEDRYRGLELYDKNWKFIRQLHPEIGHWMRGIDAFGDEVIYCSAGFGVQEFWHRHNVDPGDYVSVRLKDGYVRKLLDLPKWARHIASAVSIWNNPNYTYVAYRACTADPAEFWAPYWGEIVEIPTDGSQKARRLVHHRTRKIDGQSQRFYQPDFNVNHAGNVIIYRSAYTHDYCDLYMFHFAPREGGSVDNVPPNSPVKLSSPEQTMTSITLAWQAPPAASDGDIASGYRIYRDEQFLQSVFNNTFADNGLLEGHSYSYKIFSVDKSGNISLDAATGTFRTLADNVAPQLTLVQPTSPNRLVVYFSEPVDKASAEDNANYRIEPEVAIPSARLLSDSSTVELSTDTLQAGVSYTLYVSGIKDRARIANTIDPSSRSGFRLLDGFFDDFESGTTDNWQFWHDDLWQVRTDAGDRSLFLGLRAFESPGGQRLGEYALIRSLTMVKADFEFTCYAKSAEYLQTDRHADYALVFGYQDTLNYYYVQFHSYDVLACQVLDGQRMLLKKIDVPQSWNDYTRIDLHLRNDSLTVYVSEKMVLFTPISNYSGGSFGLGSFNDAAYFDDVALRFSVSRDILAPEPPRGISLKLH